VECSAPQPVPAFTQPSFRDDSCAALKLREANTVTNISAGGRPHKLTIICSPSLQFVCVCTLETSLIPLFAAASQTFVSISWLRACTRQKTPSAASPGRCCLGPPIMAGLTPSPDISPVSAATTNGLFPRDSFCLNLSALPDASSFMLKSALRSPHLLESPNGLFFGSGGLNSYRKRPRNMSQSSGTDREMSTNGTPPATSQAGSTARTSSISNGTSSEQRPPNKKRPSTDAIDYPRRRATIAVLLHMFIYPPLILTVTV
jgi:hypothetical protein